MVMVRKPIIANPVYCEILFHIGTTKRYASELIPDFKKDDLAHSAIGEEHWIWKKQSVLSRQMDYLEQEGFLKSTKDKVKHNKKFFYVNFEKIITAFIDYCVEYRRTFYAQLQETDKKKFGADFREGIDKLKSKDFREKSKKNIVVNFLFREILADLRQQICDKYITLKDVFNLLCLTGGLADYDSRIEMAMAKELDEAGKDVQKGLFTRPKADGHEPGYFMKAEFKDDYDFFQEFANAVSLGNMTYISKHILEEIPYLIGEFLIKGVSDSTRDFLNFKN